MINFISFSLDILHSKQWVDGCVCVMKLLGLPYATNQSRWRGLCNIANNISQDSRNIICEESLGMEGRMVILLDKVKGSQHG